MRLYTFEIGGQTRTGVEANNRLYEINADMLTLIKAGEQALEQAQPAIASGEAQSYEFADVRICAPLARPGKILCSGLTQPP